MFSICVVSTYFLDAEKQLAAEKESLENLRKQIGEAQKQSGNNTAIAPWSILTI